MLGADVEDAVRRVQQAGERVGSRCPDGGWAGRELEDVAPQTYRPWVS